MTNVYQFIEISIGNLSTPSPGLTWTALLGLKDGDEHRVLGGVAAGPPHLLEVLPPGVGYTCNTCLLLATNRMLIMPVDVRHRHRHR